MSKKDIAAQAILDSYGIDDFIGIKFGKRAHNQDILEGKLYLNTVEYFRNLEENKKKAKGIADGEDSCFVIHNGKVDAYDENGEVLYTFDFQKGACRTCANRFLFCLYAMNRENIKNAYTDDDSNYLYVECGFSEQQKADIKMLFDDPESALFILNKAGFTESIAQAVKDMGGSVVHNKVIYRDHSFLTPDYVESFSTNIESMAFYKDRFFAPEHEHRYLIDVNNLRDGHYLDYKKQEENIFLLDIDKALNGRFVIRCSLD